LLRGEYKVTAIGFSTFVMNLVGVDRHGHLVGDEATLSYACQTAEVNAEVEDLKW
jgi:gluconokinase